MLISILPGSEELSFFRTCPLLLIKALVPLFADLAKYKLPSIDLKIALAKCCCGPIELPNHASSEIFIIKFVVGSAFCIKSGKIIS
mgnify:CR=1 FL=1